MNERFLLATVVLLSGMLGGWIGLMYLDNNPPYIYDAVQSHIIPDPASQGATVVADWHLKEVKRLCPATVQRFFNDAETGRMVATLDTTEASRVVQVGDTALPRSFQLPPNLPPRTEYSALVCFQCNVLQRAWPLCVRTPKIAFSVR